jgi:amidase
MTPGSASQRSVKHGSILSGNFWTSRVSSQWKSTVRGLAAIHAYGRAVAALFETYDVVLLSTLGSPAIPIGHLTEDLRRFSERLFAFMPNTQAFNNTGQPAMTVPLAWSKTNLPIGLQFVGRMGDEATLFRLAAQLEAAKPWFDRVAPI